MKIKIDVNDFENIKKINDTEIQEFIKNIKNYEIEENQAVEFMELLYEKSNEYLSNPDYNNTSESTILEKVADYIYDKTN